MEIVIEITSLRYDVRIYMPQDSPASLKDACRIVEDAVRLEAKLTTYMDDLPIEMVYKSFSNDILSEDNFNKPYLLRSMITFCDLQETSFCHIIWYDRIHVLQIILEFSRYPRHTSRFGPNFSLARQKASSTATSSVTSKELLEN